MTQRDNVWAGMDLDKLPTSMELAADSGCKYFFTGRDCARGHQSPRYTKGGRCVDCSIIDAENRRNGDRRGENFRIRRERISKAIESMSAERSTYVPDSPCAHGHLLRFKNSGNCVECSKASARKRRYRAKEARLLKKYGLTLEAKSAIIDQQGGVCPICQTDLDFTIQHVDHCHLSGCVRGVLCSKCNQAIGLLNDNTDSIRRAAEYLSHAA